MAKRFQRGLVVGKFAPLHRGHEMVIRRALEACKEVVLISYSQPELPGCEPARRERWLAALFPTTRRLVVTAEMLAARVGPGDEPREIPHNTANDLDHRRFCAWLCLEWLGGPVEAIFTSEAYGDGFARELTRCFRERNPGARAVHHELVDEARLLMPISGTVLRQDVHGQREWLSPEVYASFVRRICILGGESTGKSTLAVALAQALETLHVAEYGRDLWETKGGALVFDDMLAIGQRQVEMEDEAAGRANRYLFCDTSPLTTLFYSQHLFQRAATALEELARRAYDVTVLCAPDFPFVQDGTRQPESFRLLQHAWYVRELSRRGIAHELVTGQVAERVARITKRLTSV